MENLIGTYPIIIDGNTVGSVDVSQKGLYTVFEASCPDTGELLRLWVFGSDGEAYLGVMAPQGGALRLVRRFSRAALKDFPKNITHAGPKKETQAAPSPLPAQSEQRDKSDDEEQDTIWHRASNGTLISTSNGRKLLAVPVVTPGLPISSARERRTIEGTEYLIFEIKGGRII
ncbi:MAG: hypothetical protein ACOX7I_01865 [Oscillospiraceae bacterium]|jgi:hypothetical protein